MEVIITVTVGKAVPVEVWAVQPPLDKNVDEIDELLDTL